MNLLVSSQLVICVFLQYSNLKHYQPTGDGTGETLSPCKGCRYLDSLLAVQSAQDSDILLNDDGPGLL